MSETEALFGVLRQSADAGCAAAIEGAVANAPDHELCRINALAFAAKNKLDEERTIAATQLYQIRKRSSHPILP